MIEDRRRVYQRQLAAKAYMKRAIEQHLEAHDPSWRVPLRAQQWEEEYRHALEAVSDDQVVKEGKCDCVYVKSGEMGMLYVCVCEWINVV